MVYLKSGLLAHFSRATKQQSSAFFTANSAHSTALSVVRPKLGLVADKATFSSWNGHSYAASGNSGSGSSHGLIALTASNDDTLKDGRRPHRSSFRTISTRRYSASAAVRQVVTEPVKPSDPVELTITDAKDAEQARKVSRDLESLLESEKYADVCESFFQHVEARRPLDSAAFRHVFAALDVLSRPGTNARSTDGIGSDQLQNMTLRAAEELQKSAVVPDLETCSSALAALLRQHKRIEDLQLWSIPPRLPKSSRQAIFAEDTQRKLRHSPDDVARQIVELFRRSTAAGSMQYSTAQLNSFLRVCAASGDAEAAGEIFAYFDTIGVRRTHESFAALIEAQGRARDVKGLAATYTQYKRDLAMLPEHDVFALYFAIVRGYNYAAKPVEAISFWESVVILHGPWDSEWRLDPVLSSFWHLNEHTLALGFAMTIEHEAMRDKALGYACACAVERGDREYIMAPIRAVKNPVLFNSGPHRPFEAAIGFLAKKGQLDDMLEVCEICIKANIDNVHIGVWSLATSRLLAAGRIDDAMRLVQYTTESALAMEMMSKRADLSTYLEIFVFDMSELQLWDEKLLLKTGNLFSNVWWTLYPAAAVEWLRNVRDHVDRKLLNFDGNVLRQMTRVGMAIHPLKQPRFIRPSQFKIEQDAIADAGRSLVKFVVKGLRQGVDQQDSRMLSDLSSIAMALDMDKAVQFLEQTRFVPQKSSEAARRAPRLSLPTTRQAFATSQQVPAIDAQVDAGIASIASRDVRPGHHAPQTIGRVVGQVTDVFQRERLITGETMMKVIAVLAKLRASRELAKLQDLLLQNVHKVAAHKDLATSAEALILDSLVTAWFELDDQDRALHFRKRLLDSDFLPSARSFATSIARLDDTVCHDTASRAVDIFQEAMDLGVQPDVYLFNTVIAKLAKARRSDEAFKLFEEMKLSGLQPSAVTYGTIINACCRVGKSEQAEALLDEMEAISGGPPRIAPYNTLIQHFVQTKRDREKALLYWDRLQRRAIVPTSHSYRLLIEAYGHLPPADPAAAENVIRAMHASKVPIESIHHAQILHMYGTVLEDLRAAKRYFGKIRAQGAVVDEVLMQAIIECYVRNHDLPGMEAMMAKMPEFGIAANAYITNLAIQGYGDGGYLDKARALFDALPTNAGPRGKEPSTYEAMIRLYASTGDLDRGREVLEQLREQRYPPAVVARAAALVA